MSLSPWLSWPLFRSHSRRGQRRNSPSRRKKARFSLEPLEARALLASYTAAGVSDLIADITAANTAGASNTITLTAATTAPYVLTAVNNTTDGATGLPVIAANDNLTIVGNSDTVERSTASGTAAFRLLDVATGGSLALQSLTVQGGLAFGSGVSAEGGAIDNQGNLTLSDVTVENNIAQGASASTTAGQNAEGGAIYSSGLLTLSGGTTVENNRALGGSGTPATYSALAAGSGYGGALYVASSTVNLTNVTLSSNTAQGGNGGNALKAFSSHPGAAGNGFGGALYVAGGTVTLTSDSVSFNAAQGGQGGSLSGYAGSNQPGGSGSGGALYASAGTVYVNSSTLFSDFAQGGSGGGLGSSEAAGGNGYGGAIVIGSAGVNMSGDTLSSNTAEGGNSGAGVNYGNLGNGLGGGIYQYNLSKLGSVLLNTTLSSNTAQGGSAVPGAARGGNGLGGAIYVGYGSIELDMSAVSSNLAQGGTPSGLGEGGGLFIAAGGATVKGNTIQSNSATSAGGGIYVQAYTGWYVWAGEDGFGGTALTGNWLACAINANQTTITLYDNSAIVPGTVVIGSEAMTVTSVNNTNFGDGSTLTVVRGVDGTTAASHAAGASVYPALGLDAFTLANLANNTAPNDPNIDGAYTESTPVLQSIAVTPANPSVPKGETEQFTATGTYSDNSTQNLTSQVTWASVTPSVATISKASGSQGLATGVMLGTSTISAKLNGVTSSTVLTVSAAVLQSIAVTPADPSVPSGETEQFTATGTYSDNSTQNLTSQVTWASVTPSVATISKASGSQGLATGVMLGTSTISATLNGVTSSTVLTVSAAVLQSIAVTPADPSVPSGETEQFTATGTYSDNSTQNLTSQVTWASATPSVATISSASGSQGLATGVAMGSCTISATLNGFNGSTVLTVSAAVLRSIAVSPANPSVPSGETEQFTATGTYSDNSTQNLTSQVTWASARTWVATISNASGSQGLATGVATDPSTISATLNGVTGSSVLTVSAPVLQSIGFSPANPSVPSGETEQLTATGTYSDNSTQNLTSQVTWASATPSVATISNASGSHGLATGVAMGPSTISATLNGVTGSTVLTVSAGVLQSIAVSPANPSVPDGETEQFTATGTYSDNSTQILTSEVTWASDTTPVATISSASGTQGLATGVAMGPCMISATLNGVTGSTVLTVSAPVLQSIAVSPANPSVPKGETEQFTATGTYSDNFTQNLTSQVTWVSATTSVATISSASGTQGLATGVAMGPCTISATLNGVTGSTVLTVSAPVLQSIAVSPANPSVPRGETEQCTATGTYSDNSTQNLTNQVTWASATTSVATISSASGTQGLATAAAAGTSTISATLNGVAGSSVLTVSAAVLQSIAVSPASPSVPKGGDRPVHGDGNVLRQLDAEPDKPGYVGLGHDIGGHGLERLGNAGFGGRRGDGPVHDQRHAQWRCRLVGPDGERSSLAIDIRHAREPECPQR